MKAQIVVDDRRLIEVSAEELAAGKAAVQALYEAGGTADFVYSKGETLFVFEGPADQVRRVLEIMVPMARRPPCSCP